MLESVLENAGLSKNEAKIYLALIERGPCTIADVCNKTSIHRRNVYDSLESLKGKGFVSMTRINNHNFFEAANPRVLIDFVEEKKFGLESILPRILAKQNPKKSVVNIYTGQQGRKVIFEDKLNYAGEQYVLGAHEPRVKRAAYIENYHLRRIQKKIPLKMLFINKDIETAKRFSKYSLVKARILSNDFESPTAINIYGNKVAFLLGSGSVDPISILIEDEGLAKEFKSYFNSLWKMSRSV